MTAVVLVSTSQVVEAISQLAGLAILAATLAAVVAVGYRWLTRERVPVGLALLAGLAAVAVYLNTSTVLGRVIDGETATIEAALFNIGAFALGSAGALAGHRIGNAFGRDVLHGGDRDVVDREVSRLVKTVGRVTVVDAPETVGDVVGYDPVPERTRESIAGNQFVFPRNLTFAELERRIESRLKTDYGVGAVDIELTDDGIIEHLAVGSRAAGIGPTLPPATNAVALRADPAFAASVGDVVQVWETDPMRRVLTGELRGVAGDVVTVAINSADTPKVDPTRKYRLVTLPVEDRPAREFASLLRSADQSYTSVTVEAGSPLHGMPVGALDLAVVGVKPEDSEPVALPSREYILSPGALLFVVGLPESLRKLTDAARALDPSLVTDAPSGTSKTETEPPRETGSQQSSPESGTEGSPPASGTEAGDDRETDATEATDDELELNDPPGGDHTEADTPVTGKADASSFERLKAEYDQGVDWSEQDNGSPDTPVEQFAADSKDGESEPDTSDTEGTSFEDLKAEFESGEADWDDAGQDAEADGTAEDDVEVAFDSEPNTTDEDTDGPTDENGDSDLVSLEEADISFDSPEDDAEGGSGGEVDSGFDEDDDDEFDDGLEEDFGEERDEDFGDGFDSDVDSLDGGEDDLSSLSVGGDAEDDIASLSLDEGDTETLFEDDPFEDDDLFADDDVADSIADEADEMDDDETSEEEDETPEKEGEGEEDDDEDEDDGSSSGGGSTFAQLKEEFESGEADWEDDISDSPGGDMRLDE